MARGQVRTVEYINASALSRRFAWTLDSGLSTRTINSSLSLVNLLPPSLQRAAYPYRPSNGIILPVAATVFMEFLRDHTCITATV